MSSAAVLLCLQAVCNRLLFGARKWPGTEIWKGDGPLAHFGALLSFVLKPACAIRLPLALASLLWLSTSSSLVPTHMLNCSFFWLSGLCRPAPCQCSWDQADDGPAKNCTRYPVSYFVGKCLHMIMVQGVIKADFRAIFAAVTVVTGWEQRYFQLGILYIWLWQDNAYSLMSGYPGFKGFWQRCPQPL